MTGVTISLHPDMWPAAFLDTHTSSLRQSFHHSKLFKRKKWRKHIDRTSAWRWDWRFSNGSFKLVVTPWNLPRAKKYTCAHGKSNPEDLGSGSVAGFVVLILVLFLPSYFPVASCGGKLGAQLLFPSYSTFSKVSNLPSMHIPDRSPNKVALLWRCLQVKL